MVMPVAASCPSLVVTAVGKAVHMQVVASGLAAPGVLGTSSCFHLLMFTIIMSKSTSRNKDIRGDEVE